MVNIICPISTHTIGVGVSMDALVEAFVGSMIMRGLLEAAKVM